MRRYRFSRCWFTFCTYDVIDAKRRVWRRVFGVWWKGRERFKTAYSAWKPLNIPFASVSGAQTPSWKAIRPGWSPSKTEPQS